jgi:RND superfamily putative drug exporter
MRASAPTRAAAWLIVALRWPIVLGWLAAVILVLVYLPNLEEAGDERSLVGLVPRDAEALAVGIRSAELFSVPVVTHTAVVQREPAGLAAPVVERTLRRAKQVNDRGDPELKEVEGALPILNARELLPWTRESGTTAITFLFFDPNRTDLASQAALTERYAGKHARDGRAYVGVTGAVPARMEEWRRIESALPWVTLATIAVIALILGLHFRSPVAPLVTLAGAGIAYVVALHTVGVIGRTLELTIPRDAEPVLVVLLLGVATDYAIFFLHGMRERLRAGEDSLEAARHATAEYLPIVVTAGLIVAGGTAALVAGRLDFFRALGPGMALTVLITLLATITFIPAAMAIGGRRIFWPRRVEDEPAPPERPGRTARLAATRPVALVVAVVALAGLLFASRGVLKTDLGVSQIAGLPTDSEPSRAARAATRGFVAGILSPTIVLVEGVDPGDVPPLRRLERLLADVPGVAATIGPGTEQARATPGLVYASDEGAVRYLLVLEAEAQSSSAIAVVRDIREAIDDGLLADAGLPRAEARLAGDSALADETVETITHDLLRIGLAAFAVNLLLLAIFLRAIVAPVYLVLASTLALAAALGLTTLVFQGILGHDDLTYYVPFAVAVLLLSLGSDYNVFVVGRIRKAAEEMPLRDAIATAAPRASRAIGVAGLALAGSFATLALVELRQFRELAFAMVVGVLLDAFLIRALLIPALISLVGTRSWWPSTRRAAVAAEPS